LIKSLPSNLRKIAILLFILDTYGIACLDDPESSKGYSA